MSGGSHFKAILPIFGHKFEDKHWQADCCEGTRRALRRLKSMGEPTRHLMLSPCRSNERQTQGARGHSPLGSIVTK